MFKNGYLEGSHSRFLNRLFIELVSFVWDEEPSSTFSSLMFIFYDKMTAHNCVFLTGHLNRKEEIG